MENNPVELMERLREHAQVVGMPCLSGQAADLIQSLTDEIRRKDEALELIAKSAELDCTDRGRQGKLQAIAVKARAALTSQSGRVG